MLQIGEAQLTAYVGAVLLPLFRILGLFSAAPILSHRSLPIRARVGLALIVATVIVPFSTPPAIAIADTARWIGAGVQEALIGLAFGFLARSILAGVEMAGELIGLQMGLSYAGFFDPASGTGNAVGRLVSTLALLTFVVLDGPQMLLVAVIRSFAIIPPGGDILHALNAERFAQLSSALFSTALTIAIPIVAMQFVVNLILGVAAKIAPQFNIFSVGFPITIVAGLTMLALSAPMLDRALIGSLEQILRMLGL